MRKALIISVIAPCLAGCLDQARGRMPTAPEATIHRSSKQEAEVDILSTAQTSSDFWARLTPEERYEARQTFARVYAEAGDTYSPAQVAIAENLPSRTRALVIRNPEPASRPILIFSEQTFDDLNLLLSISALSRDAGEKPTLSRRRVLRISSSGTVVDESDGSTYRLSGQFVEVAPPSRRELASSLLLTALSITTAHVPGVGPVRLLNIN
jgi:hypothetical protein